MKNKLLTFPNFISFLRLPLGILIVLTLDTNWKYLFLLIAVLADGLDGYAARKLKQVSVLGAILDVIFDKFFVLVVFFGTWHALQLHPIFIFIFFLRDICTSVGFLLYRKQLPRVQARFSGKVVTVLQFFTLLTLILQNRAFVYYAMSALLIATCVSLIDYAVWFRRTTALVSPDQP